MISPKNFFLPLVSAIVFSLTSTAQVSQFTGRVVDSSGAVIQGASVVISKPGSALEITATTDLSGAFSVSALPPGTYELTASAKGFAVRHQVVPVPFPTALDIMLKPGEATEEVEVVGTHLVSNAEVAKRTPGAVDVIDEQTLETSHVYNFSEALRKATGVNVRDEEGFGLRPNIGLRGLNPTRSTKVLLLEDGVPLTYAPYGDNASYYHPPVERYQAIEVLKGSGQIMYGPSTVGGVINYVTPDPPSQFGGNVTLLGGSRDYLNGQGQLGGTWHGLGILADVMRKQGDGARANVESKLDDYNLKVSIPMGSRQTLTLQANRYAEDSQVTYSGLRLDEWEQDPRQNPFANDAFHGNRVGASLHHTLALGSNLLLVTKAYGSSFSRDWWRQSSNSNQRPNDASDPDCGGMANLNTTCGNEGRLRDFTNWGIEPRLRLNFTAGGIANEADFGFRAHFETQERRQRNGATPDARTGVVVENNQRKNQAYSVFVQNKFSFGRLTVTPGVRVERVFFDRTNRLANDGAGVNGLANLTQAIPGVGAAYHLNPKLTLFAGVHRGFAPPRTEDIISNSGGVVELDPELSWNYEVGLRSSPARALRFDATYFRMDYENQIIPASLAGGVGATLTNGGATLHQGSEFSGRFDLGTLLHSPHNVYVRTSYTWIPTAEFVGTRFSNISGFSDVSITGNRLPYAPEHLLTNTFGYSHSSGLSLMFELVHISDQFTDDLNTIESTPDGQRGLISDNNTWNAAINYREERLRSTFFVAVKNLADATFLVDRSRGMLPNSPRLVHGGVKYTF